MIRALYSAASGMAAQQMNVDNIAHNLANANTVGFKMPARAVSGSALPERDPTRRGGRPADRGADRAPARPRHAPVVERNHLHPGQLFANQQPAGHGDPGPRLFPGAPPVGRAGLYAGRLLPPGPRRQYGHFGRQPDRAADHHSSRCAGDHHRAGRHGQLHPAQPDRSPAGGADPAREFPEPGGPEQPRRQPLRSHRRLRRSDCRRSRRAGGHRDA